MLLVGRPEGALGELATEIGERAHAFSIDLSEADAGERIEGKLAEVGAYCDVLVNSAGVGVFGPAAETSRKEHLDLVDVNIRAVTELTLRFLPGMIARRRGGVLNLGSITGYTPGPDMSTYFASKAYVRSFTTAVAEEVRGTGVTVTCFSPGVVRTAFFERFGVGKTRLFKLAPRSDPAAAAEAGWRGFRAGKRLVIPRFVDRLIVGGCLILPDAVLLRLISALMGRRRGA